MSMLGIESFISVKSEQSRVTKSLKEASIEDLLTELIIRGNTFGAVAEAQMLVLKKSQDYNNGAKLTDRTSANARDVYFPFGLQSYAHMIHTKSLRLVSLANQKRDSGTIANFESVRDTTLDLINYASFLAERLSRDGNL